jgi:hypothetical protein
MRNDVIAGHRSAESSVQQGGSTDLDGLVLGSRLYEHAFVTSQGSAYHRFRRALDRGNVTAALSAASEIRVVGLVEALELTLLRADREPAKYEWAALRWHTRFVHEHPSVDVRESQATLALLAALPDHRDAAAALAELLSRRRGLERAREVLVAWARREGLET